MEFPLCPNFVKHRGCERSDIILMGEQEDSWTLHCRGCTLVWVVSKPTAIARSRLRQQEEELRKRAEVLRARDKSPIYFT